MTFLPDGGHYRVFTIYTVTSEFGALHPHLISLSVLLFFLLLLLLLLLWRIVHSINLKALVRSPVCHLRVVLKSALEAGY